MKKKLITLIVTMVLCLSTMVSTTFAAEGTWQIDNNGWWYQKYDGSFCINEWTNIDGDWYHFDEAGYMTIGWYFDGGYWNYLNS